MPSLPIDVGPVPACVVRAAADYAIPIRALLAVKAAMQPKPEVRQGFAAGSPYPVNRAWLTALARTWRLKSEALTRDVCWTAQAASYVLRYEINRAGGDFWTGVASFVTSVPPGQPVKAAEISKLIDEAARQNKLDPALIRAIVEVESNYQPEARSSKGAVGLMQLMPTTAARYGVTDQRELFTPSVNIAAGAKYLANLWKMFDGNVQLTVAAYNAGEGAVVKYGLKVPPYAETQRYVQAVTTLYGPTFQAKVYEASLLF